MSLRLGWNNLFKEGRKEISGYGIIDYNLELQDAGACEELFKCDS